MTLHRSYSLRWCLWCKLPIKYGWHYWRGVYGRDAHVECQEKRRKEGWP